MHERPLDIAEELSNLHSSLEFELAMGIRETRLVYERRVGVWMRKNHQRIRCILKTAIAELKAVERALAKGGEALILCLDKIEKDWMKKFAAKSKLSIYKVLTREGYTVVRLS